MERRLEVLQRLLPELIKEGELLRFAAGQIVYYAGHTPNGLFVLQSGTVQHLAPSSSPSYPPQHGPILGLYQLLADISYDSTCKATSNIEVVFLPKALIRSRLTPDAEPLDSSKD